MVPAFSLGVVSGAAWRAGLLALLLLTATVAAAWLVELRAAELGVAALVGLSVLLLGLTTAALTLLHTRPATLRWDGRQFALGEPPLDGKVDVCLDVGGWLLLRFRPAGSRHPWTAAWLPVSAAGCDASQWHALRCALHAPTPLAAPPDV